MRWDLIYMISSSQKGWDRFHSVSKTGVPAEVLGLHILQLFCPSYRFPWNFLTDSCFHETWSAPVFIRTGTAFLCFEVGYGTIISRVISTFLWYTPVDTFQQEMSVIGKFKVSIYFIWLAAGKICGYQLEAMGWLPSADSPLRYKRHLRQGKPPHQMYPAVADSLS